MSDGRRHFYSEAFYRRSCSTLYSVAFSIFCKNSTESYAVRIYKELERIIKFSGIGLSVDKVIDIAKTIISIDIKTDGVKRTARRTLFLTEEQKIIQPLFDLEKLVHHFG